MYVYQQSYSSYTREEVIGNINVEEEPTVEKLMMTLEWHIIDKFCVADEKIIAG